ncbi:TetR/AcrR family transcriptional regulator [Luteimonas vadosa]|uniref:TetR/AcrR family transcriptional regulator n=1 Tax=Luteimonas vadosa TaxID=1165507 RepID=A0ABP9E3E3_9GAMM
MSTRPTAGRTNQRRRTRKALLQAASRLMQRLDHAPSLEEVAEEALVSRATAYRYFPGVEALLAEAALDIAVPEASALFGDGCEEPVARLFRVDDALHEVLARNEGAMRVMLAQSLQADARGARGEGVPARQNRRSPLIEAALAPAKASFNPRDRQTLAHALALVVGTEAMLVCRDVLQIDDAQARELKRWMIRALVAAARKPGHVS